MRSYPLSAPLPIRHAAWRLRGLFSIVATCLAWMLVRPSNAAWQPDGVPLSPHPTDLQSNSFRALVADAANGAYAVWEFQATDPYYYTYQYELRAQRVDVLGNRPAPWTASGSLIRSWTDGGGGTYNMAPIGLYPDGSGGAVLAVLDYVLIGDYQTLFRLYGIAPGSAVTAITIQNSALGGYPVQEAAADGDGAGGAVLIALEQTFAPPPNPPPPGRLYAQRINSSGAPLWPQVSGAPGVVLNTTGDTQTTGVAALSDGAGGAFVAWIDRRDVGDPDLYVQHLDAGGAIAPGWPVGGLLVSGAAGAQLAPQLAPAGAGGAFVLWRDDRSGVARLYGHLVHADGTLDPAIPADGRQLPSADNEDRFIDLIGDGQGGCFVARTGVTPTSAMIQHLHRLDAALLPRPGWPAMGIALNTLSPSTTSVGLAPDGLGGAFASFRNGVGTAAPEGLYAQHFAADGTPAPGWGAGGYRLSGVNGIGEESDVVRSGNGAIVAWNDGRTAYRGVYAQRLVPDGPVAAQLALVSASADEGRVALRWYVPDGAAFSAAIERNVGGAGWETLAAIRADGTGLIVYEDAAITPGTRYGYRLEWRDGAIPRTGGEVWITVPRTLALALDAPSPNPSSGAVALAVTLPAARGARLDLFDMAGRRVAGRDLAGLGAGRHVVTLAETRALAPGLYVVQLTQGGAALRQRLVRIE